MSASSDRELTTQRFCDATPGCPVVDDALVADEAPDPFWWVAPVEFAKLGCSLEVVDSFQRAHGSSYRGQLVGEALSRHLEQDEDDDAWRRSATARWLVNRARGGRV